MCSGPFQIRICTYLYGSRSFLLKGPTCHIRCAREWYQLIGLNRDMPRYRFFIFYFWSWIFKRSSKFYSTKRPTSRSPCIYTIQFLRAVSAVEFWTCFNYSATRLKNLKIPKIIGKGTLKNSYFMLTSWKPLKKRAGSGTNIEVYESADPDPYPD